MTHVSIGTGSRIDSTATIGYGVTDTTSPTQIGDGARVRSSTVIYHDVKIGDELTTGHGSIIREGSRVGDDATVGTGVVLDGDCRLGSQVSLQTRSYVPPESELGDRVFLGPYCVLTNDPVPLRGETELDGPTIEDDVSVGAQATVLPGLTIGSGAFVAAGAVVTSDVPPDTLAVGVPARHRELPSELARRNLFA